MNYLNTNRERYEFITKKTVEFCNINIEKNPNYVQYLKQP